MYTEAVNAGCRLAYASVMDVPDTQCASTCARMRTVAIDDTRGSMIIELNENYKNYLVYL